MGSAIVSFDMFEHQKENIQPVQQGHSAVALAKAFSVEAMNANRDKHAQEHEAFEKRIEGAEDLDDPLEVWLEYLGWTHEAYPQGASAESGLISLLERCATQFQDAQHYENDPRYLRVWLEYARYNDSPSEVFSFLRQHGIGLRLATFYEEYAHYLESIGHKHQADDIFRMGIENEARPLDRLRRRYSEFLQRLEVNPADPNEPRSPTMPLVRPALATLSLSRVERGSNPQQQQPHQPLHTEPSESSRTRPKMSIFNDPEGGSAIADRSGGWKSIGTINERRKENTMDAKPLAGETMRMPQSQPSATREKLTIFRDSASEGPSQQSQFKVPALPQQGQKVKREEKFVVNMDALYPEGENEEMSFEELRAIARGLLLQKSANSLQQSPVAMRPVVASLDPSSTPTNRAALVDRTPRRPSSEAVVQPDIREQPTLQPFTVQTQPLKDSPNNNRRRPASPTMTVHTRAATDEIYSMFNQPLKCDMDEVEAQGIPDSSDEEEEEDEEDEDDEEDNGDDSDSDSDDDDEHEGDKSDNYGPRSDREVDGDDECGGKYVIEKQNDNINDSSSNGVYCDDAKDMNGSYNASHIVPATPHHDRAPMVPKERYGIAMMTPIVETTESISTITRSTTSKQNRLLDNFEEQTESSPFVEHPAPRGGDNTINDIIQFSPISNDAHLMDRVNVSDFWSRKPIITDLLVNPMDESIRNTILENADPSLQSRRGYFYHNGLKLGRSEALKRYVNNKKNNTSSENADIELRGSVYRVRRELGEGAFAPVYLFEMLDSETFLDNEKSQLCAIKMEHPPSAWEFYIMQEIERRLSISSTDLPKRALDSIIHARELHMFGDTSCLILDYNDQGTILDIVNLVKADSVTSSSAPVLGLDECLAMFFTIELLRTIEALHEAGVLHGDLKPDNCMVRILSGNESASMASLSLSESASKRQSNKTIRSPYQANGEQGWSTKGISLIDFGRAIDLTVYDHNRDVQFIADWNTSAQDCAEIRELRPWTYQVDYHGLANIIHMMLFGKYIEITADSQYGHGRRKHYRITQSFKRYWQQDMWKELFEVLLNSVAVSLEGTQDVCDDNTAPMKRFPITGMLRNCREKMEEFLETNGERNGMSLRTSLQKLEILISAERKKAGI
ncbi:Mad3/BUB1 homology region 1-domain-containing protein [Lipomyces kononenkoae]|uniref:Mad3/BUB1 homology region 1-domain-containing protein n=1 Tax=Lipomyces kononenkoae TaxID=34357 RepID=A0ACC3SYL5_LIPKO